MVDRFGGEQRSTSADGHGDQGGSCDAYSCLIATVRIVVVVIMVVIGGSGSACICHGGGWSVVIVMVVAIIFKEVAIQLSALWRWLVIIAKVANQHHRGDLLLSKKWHCRGSWLSSCWWKVVIVFLECDGD